MGASSAKGSRTGREGTQTQGNMPPSWALPLFTQGANDGLALYRRGQGGNAYTGQRVTDLSNQTHGAIDGLSNNATRFNNPNLQTLINQQTSASRNLGEMATGATIGNNAAFDQSLQNTLDNTATTINSRMSGAGRYGSGAHNRILTQNLGQIAANQTADQYNRDIQNMLAANNQIDSANQNQLNSAGNFLNRQADAYTRALAGGRVLDDQAQAQVDARRQQFEDEDNQDWNRLGLLANAANSFAGSYGSSHQKNETATRKNPDLLETIGGLGRMAGKGKVMK